jgi:hypothetical protein
MAIARSPSMSGRYERAALAVFSKCLTSRGVRTISVNHVGDEAAWLHGSNEGRAFSLHGQFMQSYFDYGQSPSRVKHSVEDSPAPTAASARWPDKLRVGRAWRMAGESPPNLPNICSPSGTMGIQSEVAPEGSGGVAKKAKRVPPPRMSIHLLFALLLGRPLLSNN